MAALYDGLRRSLWFVPSVMAVCGIGLAFAIIALDRRSSDLTDTWFFLYSGGPEGARSVLSTIAGSMITVAGVTFSITIVALSSAASELGPRILRNFTADRGNQAVLGTFVGTFVFCLLVLRTIRESPGEFVPHVGVTAGLVLALVSLAVLIYFIHHVSMVLQADHAISVAARELSRTIEHVCGSARPGDASGDREEEARRLRDSAAYSTEIRSARSGYVEAINTGGLVRSARESGFLAEALVGPGQFIRPGDPLIQIYSATVPTEAMTTAARDTIVIGRTRAPRQDLEFAFEQLVEVGVRALSTGMNDPFTAMTAIDYASVAVLQVMEAPATSPYLLDENARLRVVRPILSFERVAGAAFNQLRESAGHSPSVMRHLAATLRALRSRASSPEHAAVLDEQLGRVSGSAARTAAHGPGPA